MQIQKIEIERFRCVLSESLSCDSLTALVGRNGAGKSSFLHALRLFYAVSPSVTEEDFYNRQTAEPIQIRVTFGKLLPQEVEAFGSYSEGGALTLTKRISLADGKAISKTFAASSQYPEFAKIRAIASKKELKEAFNALVDQGVPPGLAKATGAPDAEGKMTAWEAANPGECKAIEREVQFVGPASIGVGMLDNFTKFVFIPAVRDVADEAGDGRGSALAALLDLAVTERVEARPELQALREHIKTRYATIFAPENQPELAKLATEISHVLRDFHPGAAIELGWRAASPPELGIPSVDPTLVEDGFKGSVSRKGHGLQRALVLALLQARAESASPIDGSPGGDQTEAPNPPAPPSPRHLILVVEEPELYQHPQQCRHWAKVLRRITASPTGQGTPGSQVIFTTHSPHFVDLAWFDQVRMVRKSAGVAGSPAQAKTSATTLDAVAAELALATGQPPASFTADSMRARARPVMTNLVNEGFFASVVVLVEGGTEVGLLQEVARLREKEWDAKGIAVIDVGGKTKLTTPFVVFRQLGLPIYVVFDSDVHSKGSGKPSEEEDRVRGNRRLLKLLGAAEEDYPEQGVKADFAVVGGETAQHLRASLGEEDYTRIAGGVALELGYDGSKKAMKNVEAAARFASRVYEEGKQLPLFEELVDRITSLAPEHNWVNGA